MGALVSFVPPPLRLHPNDPISTAVVVLGVASFLCVCSLRTSFKPKERLQRVCARARSPTSDEPGGPGEDAATVHRASIQVALRSIRSARSFESWLTGGGGFCMRGGVWRVGVGESGGLGQLTCSGASERTETMPRVFGVFFRARACLVAVWQSSITKAVRACAVRVWFFYFVR